MAHYLILVLRQNPIDLPPLQVAALERCYPAGATFEWRRTDPKDYKEHLADCQRLQPAAVILPTERPIPSAAMEEGFVHLAIFPDGKVGRLEPLVPRFTDFKAV